MQPVDKGGKGTSMSTQQQSTVSEYLSFDSECDELSISDEWLTGESMGERALDELLWDALEIDDDDPQPQYGDFWYEIDSTE